MLTQPTSYKLQAISLFFLDQSLKYLARVHPDFSFYLWKPWFGWEYFTNTGIAFSLPFPRIVVLLATPALLATLLIFSRKQPAAILIVFGALGNFIDRIFFGHTIDYIRIATSVFNFADFLIIAGIIAVVLRYRSLVVVNEEYVRKDSIGGDLRH